jgi:hypothetical protein
LKELVESGISKDKEIDFLKFDDKPTYDEGIFMIMPAPRFSIDMTSSSFHYNQNMESE